MKKIIVGVIFILLIFSTELFAATQLANVHPHRIGVFGDGDLVKIGIPREELPTTCSNTANPRVMHVRIGQQGVTESGLKNILSIVMLSISTGNELVVIFDDATQNCYVKYVWMKNTP